MVKMKRFMDIVAATPFNVGGFHVGDHIVIQTKIDGANAAIRYDAETDEVVAQSRKNILSTANTLRGFYEFTQLLHKDRIKAVLRPEYIIFGEWLVPHTVQYPREAYNKFYVYDIYDTEGNKWAPQWYVEQTASLLHLPYVKTWYDGEFISWEHCKCFLPNSAYGEVEQEGIVIKDMTALENGEVVYTKIVNERFKERMENHSKEFDAEKAAELERRRAMASTIVTRARVEKLIHKMVDEGILREDWDGADMGTIAKNLGKAIFEDCMKEERETVAQIEDFGKLAAKISMETAKEILKERVALI